MRMSIRGQSCHPSQNNCRPLYLLGYLASQSRVYLIDKDFNVVSYTLLLRWVFGIIGTADGWAYRTTRTSTWCPTLRPTDCHRPDLCCVVLHCAAFDRVQDTGIDLLCAVLRSVVEYKTLVLRGDMETAASVLETIPKVRMACALCRATLSRAVLGQYYTKAKPHP